MSYEGAGLLETDYAGLLIGAWQYSICQNAINKGASTLEDLMILVELGRFFRIIAEGGRIHRHVISIGYKHRAECLALIETLSHQDLGLEKAQLEALVLDAHDEYEAWSQNTEVQTRYEAPMDDAVRGWMNRVIVDLRERIIASASCLEELEPKEQSLAEFVNCVNLLMSHSKTYSDIVRRVIAQEDAIKWNESFDVWFALNKVPKRYRDGFQAVAKPEFEMLVSRLTYKE